MWANLSMRRKGITSDPCGPHVKDWIASELSPPVLRLFTRKDLRAESLPHPSALTEGGCDEMPEKSRGHNRFGGNLSREPEIDSSE